MAIDTVASLIDVLRQYRLLDAGQLDEASRIAGVRDPRALARELLQRGWLTAYQVNQVFQGRAADLLLGSYVVLERVGEGGMGQVFKARHAKLGRTVALKVIRKDRLSNFEAMQRFRREIQIAAQLSHPNVVHSYDADQVGDRHLIAMEFVDGIDLSRLVREHGPLPIRDACDYIRQAALGLQHAHEHALVHRDIKPSNLLLTPKPKPGHLPGGPGHIKILDLGLARVTSISSEDTPSSALTQAGSVVGTPDYIAPEQARNAHVADIRSDLYSLGCTFHFLLTGQPPFPGGSMTEKLLKHHWDPPPPVESLRTDVPAIVASIVRKLMAKRADERFQIPGSLADQLAQVLAPGGFELPVPAELDFVPRPLDGELPSAIPIATPAGDGAIPAALVPALSPPPLLPQETMATPTSMDTRDGITPAPLLRRPAQPGWLVLAIFAGAIGLLVLVALAVALISSDTNPPPTRPIVNRPPTLSTTPSEAVPGSPLDKLNRDRIPLEERVPSQPKELVAVLGQHRGRHYGSVHSVACSSDGKTVASAGEDGVVRLWNALTLDAQAVLKGDPSAGMTAVAYSPDGRWLAAGNWNGEIRLWDLARGIAVDPLRLPHKESIAAVSFAPDSLRLAVALDDGTVQMWRFTQGEVRRGPVLTGHKDAVKSLAFGPDGQVLITGSADHTARLWDLTAAPPRSYATLPAGSATVNAVAIGESLAVTGNSDGAVHFWSTGSGKSRDDRPLNLNAAILAMTFSPKAGSLILGLDDNRLIVVQMSKSGPRVEQTLNDTAGIAAVAVTAGRRAIVTGNRGGLVRVWDWGQTVQDRPLGKGHAAWISGLAFASDGRSLFTGSFDQTVRMWDLGSSEPAERAVMQGHGSISSLAISPDGKRLAAGGMWDSMIRLWELPATVARLWPMTASDKSRVRDLAFVDDRTLATAGQDGPKEGNVRIWDLSGSDPQPLHTFRGHGTLLTSLAVSSKGGLLAAAGGRDFPVRVWDLAVRREIHQFPGIKNGWVGPVAIAPDGKLLAFGTAYDDFKTSDYSVHLRDLAAAPPKGLSPLPGHTTYVRCIAFDPAGQKLATADDEGRLILWDRAGSANLQDWRLPGTISALSFAPDGRHLAIGFGNGTAYILRLRSARP
jgi:serine/threonine-protein kinase